jgi:two-component system, LytTR family, response regulator
MSHSTRRRPTASAVVADDEELARRRLIELIREHESLHLVGECTSGPATLEAVRRLEPDVLFLDVQMPGFDGLEVLARLEPEERPVVVFSTAYDEYAIEAFEVNAVDYLLKPYADERFEEAVRRAERALYASRSRVDDRLEALLANRPVPDTDGPQGDGYLERFAVPVKGRWLLAPVSSVSWIEASGDYVNLHVGEKSYLLRGTMTAVEARLDPQRFLRIHRSSIVRVDAVRSVEADPHGDYTITLERGERLRVSRSCRDVVLERLGLRW